jgi:tetratricopeptide (TPR) repeat protein
MNRTVRRRKEMKKVIFGVFAVCFIFVLPILGQENGKGSSFKKAKKLYNKGECTEAIPLFKKLIKENPNKADEASYLLGMCQLKALDYQSSVDSFSNALKMRNDDYAQAVRGRAEAHMALKNYDLAIADLTKLLQSSPEDLDIAYQLGKAQYYEGNYNEAILHLEKVVAAKPQDPEVHFFTGWVYYKLKKYDLTIREFEIYVKLCPDCPEAEKIKEILRSLKG